LRFASSTNSSTQGGLELPDAESALYHKTVGGSCTVDEGTSRIATSGTVSPAALKTKLFGSITLLSPEIHCHLIGAWQKADAGDDRMNAVAFGKMMPLGARINALFSSDIGDFDVVDMHDRSRKLTSSSRTAPLPRAISPTSSSAIRCACGARRIRGSSKARGWRRKRRHY
jgi:hypothetical protein